MHPYRQAALALATSLICMTAVAGQTHLQRELAVDRHSADIAPGTHQRDLSRHAATASAMNAAVTDADVGDSDSFGREVKWLGLASGGVTLDAACPPPASPDDHCTTLLPPGVTTSFHYDDIAHISLPAKATHSLLCYWFSPVLTTSYDNPTAGEVVAHLRYSPTLTVENPVLADPSLIDPTTGLPFGGSLLTSMTSSERLETPLAPGVHFTQRTRDSAVCMAGLLSRRTLMETFGLTAAQATAFFKQPTTVRLNVAGNTQYVSSANFIFGLRIVGD